MQKRLVKFSLITSLAILLALPTVGLAVQNANVAGKWLLTISTPRGDSTITLNIEQDGSTLSGTSLREGQENSSELTGTIDGNNITLNMSMGGGGNRRAGGGALVVSAASDGGLAGILGMTAIVMAMINVVGGFMVTDRMLSMFASKKKK